MYEVLGNDTIAMRCMSRACNTRYSVRSLNRFFYYWDIICWRNSKMSTSKINEIVYYFLHWRHLNIREMREIDGHSHATLVDWLTQCRKVCALAVQRGPKLVGTIQYAVHVVVSYFYSRRNYVKGRLMSGDLSEESREEMRWKTKMMATTQLCSTRTMKYRTRTSTNRLLQHLLSMEREWTAHGWLDYTWTRTMFDS